MAESSAAGPQAAKEGKPWLGRLAFGLAVVGLVLGVLAVRGILPGDIGMALAGASGVAALALSVFGMVRGIDNSIWTLFALLLGSVVGIGAVMAFVGVSFGR